MPATQQSDGWENGTFQKCGGGTYAHTIQTHVLVPHTLGRTLLGNLRPGHGVNIEVDVLARYVARLLEFRDDR